jgi:hypothetical protein
MHHPQILAGQPLEHAGVVAQAVDAQAQLLATGLGLRDLRLELMLVRPRRRQVAIALQRRDGEQREDEDDGRPQDRAERIAPGGCFRPGHGVQRGKALAPG